MAKKRRGETDHADIEDARDRLRDAARMVRECPYCSEGWRQTEGIFTRCECWAQYVDRGNDMSSLNPDWYPTEDILNLKSPSPEKLVDISQIQSFSEDLVRKLGVKIDV